MAVAAIRKKIILPEPGAWHQTPLPRVQKTADAWPPNRG